MHEGKTMSATEAYNFDFDFIESIVKSLICDRHNFCDAELSKTSLVGVMALRIPQYLSCLQQLRMVSASCLIPQHTAEPTTRLSIAGRTSSGCCGLCMSAIVRFKTLVADSVDDLLDAIMMRIWSVKKIGDHSAGDHREILTVGRDADIYCPMYFTVLRTTSFSEATAAWSRTHSLPSR